MLDLAGLPTTALMHLSQCNPKVEGSGICWDLKISMAVEDDTEAKIIDQYIPGALRAFTEGHSRGSASVNGGFDVVRVQASNEDGDHIASAHAEIRSAKINVKQGSGTLVVMIRVYGLVEEAAIKLAYCLDQHISFSFKSQSGAVQSEASDTDANESKNYEGMLLTAVVGDETVCGIVVSHQNFSMEISTLQSADTVSVYEGDCQQVNAISLAPVDASMLAEYIDRCESAGVDADWANIVQSLGELYTSDQTLVNSSGCWTVTSQVLDNAYTIASMN